MTCTDIVKQMADTDLSPLTQPIKGKSYSFALKIFIFSSSLDYVYNHRRKSATSTCTQAGVYPDVLDCSLFHYCHQNKQHEVLQCPNGLHFDPKLFMCSASQLVRFDSLHLSNF